MASNGTNKKLERNVWGTRDWLETLLGIVDGFRLCVWSDNSMLCDSAAPPFSSQNPLRVSHAWSTPRLRSLLVRAQTRARNEPDTAHVPVDSPVLSIVASGVPEQFCGAKCCQANEA
jgi:hypothetical protein